MGTIKNKLSYLNETKQQLKDVINYANGGIISDTPFRQYPDKLYNQYIEILKDKNILFDGMPKKEIENTSIYLNDAADLPVYRFELEKESGQKITIGKNVANPEQFAFSEPSRVNLNYQDNTLTITTITETPSNNLFFRTKISDELLKNGQLYTLSCVNVSGVNNPLKLQLRNKDGSMAGLPMNISITYDDTYSLYIVGNIFAINSSTIIPAGAQAIIKNIQVEQGSTPTEYEEYTNGASPNPDYPQEVKVVEGYKNYIPINIQNETIINGITITKNDDGSCVLNGTTTANTTINLYSGEDITIPAGTYIGFMKDRINIIDGYIRENNAAYQTIFTNSSYKNTFTINDSFTFNRFYIYIISGKTFNNQIIKPMLVKGIQELPYVPYGNNYIVWKDKGKNLFDKDDVVNGYLNHNGEVVNNNSFRVSDYIKLNGNELTISGNSGSNEDICFYNNNKEFLSYQSTGTSIIKTFTIPNNAEYVRITVKLTSLDNYQVELNSTATSYEPYKETIVPLPLNNNIIAGIGTYLDEYIVDKNGHCWLNRLTGKVVLDGSESWQTNYSGATTYRYVLPVSDSITTTNQSTQIFANSNYFIGSSAINAIQNEAIKDMIAIISSNRLIITTINRNLFNLNNFKLWLSTHNTEVYYALAEPELIDLNTTVDLKLFKGINNISNSEDGNIVLQYVPNEIE